jgi:hypothetical protein
LTLSKLEEGPGLLDDHQMSTSTYDTDAIC